MNQKPEVKYPVTVKFDSVNYANVNTNGYALWEAPHAPVLTLRRPHTPRALGTRMGPAVR